MLGHKPAETRTRAYLKHSLAPKHAFAKLLNDVLRQYISCLPNDLTRQVIVSGGSLEREESLFKVSMFEGDFLVVSVHEEATYIVVSTTLHYNITL